MPCKFESRGRSLCFLIPDGSKALADMIRKALENSGTSLNSFTGRVEGLLELEGGGGCELALNSREGVVELLCVDCGGSEALGDDAVPELRRLLRERPVGGYVELMELSDAALKLDAELRPEAVVKAKVSLADAVLDAGAGGRPGIVGLSVGGVDEGSTTSAQSPEELLTVDSEVFLANVVINSRVLDVGSGNRVREFIAKAAELSRRFRGCVYRLALTLSDGEIVNVFFYGGVPCVLLRHSPGSASINILKDGVRGYLDALPSEGIKHMLLCEVSFPPIVEGVRRLCRGHKESTSKWGEGGGKAGIGGIFSKLFRRNPSNS